MKGEFVPYAFGLEGELIEDTMLRRIRFRILTVLVVTGVAGGVFAWIGYEIRRSHLQHRCIAVIGRTGGHVVYDHSWPTRDNLGSRTVK